MFALRGRAGRRSPRSDEPASAAGSSFLLLTSHYCHLSRNDNQFGLPPGAQRKIWVKDIETSVDFYRDDLGFSLVHYVVGSAEYVSELSPEVGRPYGAKLSIGEHEIHLQRVKDDDEVRPSGARYSVRVASPAEYYRRLVERDLEVNVLVRTNNGEPYWFTLRDPDGHKFIFMGPIQKPGGESTYCLDVEDVPG